MQERPNVYREEHGASLIEIRLHSVRQMFNSFDPSPFHEKDLDREAEEYIVETMQELPPEATLKIMLHLPESERASAEQAKFTDAIHNYFGYRLWVMQHRLSDLMRRGRTALALGTLFLALTLGARELTLAVSSGTAARMVAEGLQIAGWVALWQPIQVFFYDWRPMRRMVDIYRKLAKIDVDVRFTPSA